MLNFKKIESNLELLIRKFQLAKKDISVECHPITGLDHFYSDGDAVGSVCRLFLRPADLKNCSSLWVFPDKSVRGWTYPEYNQVLVEFFDEIDAL